MRRVLILGCLHAVLLSCTPLLAAAQDEDFVPDPPPAAGPLLPATQAEHPLSELLQPASPYLTIEEFTSPFTGETFNAQVLSRTPPVSSYDIDGCPHPVMNSLAYTLVIDPATGYVAFPSQFNRPVKLKRDQLDSILGQPKFEHPADSGLPWDGAYAWEKFENAARLARAGRSGHLAEANWWQQAAWSVRLDVIAGGNSFDSEVDAIFADLPVPSVVEGEQAIPYEIRLAEHYQALRAEGSFVNLAPENYALALAWLYRSRGELAAARYWLGQASDAQAGIAQESQLYSFLRSSIALEEEYLQQALSAFERGWQAGQVQASQRSAVAFAIAEIKRRLGQRRGAALWYTETENLSRGEISRSLLATLLEQCFGRGW